VLLEQARVVDGRLVLDGGASYGVLVIPGARRMDPAGGERSAALEARLEAFAREGLPILHGEQPWQASDLRPLELEPAFAAFSPEGERVTDVAWTERETEDTRLFFVSNQRDEARFLTLSLREDGRRPEIWNPVTGTRAEAGDWSRGAGRTEVTRHFAPHEAVFVVFREPAAETFRAEPAPEVFPVPQQRLDGPWELRLAGRPEPVLYKRYLDSWTLHEDPAVKHFAGTGSYGREFEWAPEVARGRVWLDLGKVANIAEVWLNEEPLGVLWTAPWRVEVTDLLRPGTNSLRIDVTNTWANRLIGDEALAEDGRTTWTNAPFRLGGRPLLEAGLLGPVLLMAEVPGRPPPNPVIPFPPEIMREARPVPPAVMERVYEELQTPFKYGIVLKGGEGEMLDCPNVFRHAGKWYMMYVAIQDGVGYQTFLAESDDLLTWKKLGCILPFPDGGWDRWQGDGGVALIDHRWGGSMELRPHDGRYWMSYIGGSMRGYETDPLLTGLAWTKTPHRALPWTRYEGNPILSPNDHGTRPFEAKTVYKTHIVHDPEERLGWPFVMYYNGKEERGGGHEAIGMAVSRDLRQWHRFGEDWIVYHRGELPWAITGDPQIIRMEDLWVMVYFGAFWKPKAFDTFAVSYDMVNWTTWDGPHLVEPSESWDAQFAHKPWVLKHQGVVYHFYCAVGDQGRVIALATSKDLGTAPPLP
jgi:predicted GH43/DUF377 family glycosyl hydrolase